jgi:collagenase-like PrtC family protease
VAVRDPAQHRSSFLHIISEIKDLVKQGRIISSVKVDGRQVRPGHVLQILQEQSNNLLYGLIRVLSVSCRTLKLN